MQYKMNRLIKKVTFFLFVAMATLVVSCSKDEDLVKDFTLEGKTYACFFNWHWDYYNNRYAEYRVIRFISSTKFELSTRYDSPVGPLVGSMNTGEYILSYPNLTLEYTTTNSSGATTEHIEEFVFLDNEIFRYTTEEGKVHDYILQ